MDKSQMPGQQSQMGQLHIYQDHDGKLEISVRFDGDTVWLTQQQLTELFQTSKQNISHHINRVFKEGELTPDSTVKKYLTVRKEGKREIQRKLDHYNLDMIISVGYRVKSQIATRFRIWATQTLKQHLVEGYTFNKQRLESFGTDVEGLVDLVQKTLKSSFVSVLWNKGPSSRTRSGIQQIFGRAQCKIDET